MNTEMLSSLGHRTRTPPISWLMAAALAQPKLISLAAGFTDNESLPVDAARELLRDLLKTRSSGEPALQYGTTAGDPRLRELTAKRLQAQDGVNQEVCSPDRLVLTNGSQQMLYMLSEALCDPGDVVLVEDPTYFVYLGIVQSHGVLARGVQMQKDGLDLAHLEARLEELKRRRLLPRLKLLYLVSYYQNPTGITTSFEKKASALGLLRRYERHAGHPIYLVEDAAYRELRFGGKDVRSSLAVSGSSNRVIYVGTYSKPFATGVRVGFGLLPEPVLSTVLNIKGNHDFGSASLLQGLLTRALNSGVYDRHLVGLRQRYARKANVMRESMRKHFPPAVEYDVPQGGLYFWARLPKGGHSGTKSRLFKAALKNQVLYVPGEYCYASDPSRTARNRELRLSFGAVTEPNLKRGIDRLAHALAETLPTSR